MSFYTDDVIMLNNVIGHGYELISRLGISFEKYSEADFLEPLTPLSNGRLPDLVKRGVDVIYVTDADYEHLSCVEVDYLCRRIGISRKGYLERVAKGWSKRQALTTPRYDSVK